MGAYTVAQYHIHVAKTIVAAGPWSYTPPIKYFFGGVDMAKPIVVARLWAQIFFWECDISQIAPRSRDLELDVS